MVNFKNLGSSFKRLILGSNERFATSEALMTNAVSPSFSSLTNCLNYSAYDDANQLFLLTTVHEEKEVSEAIGFTVELNMLIGADHETMKRLTTLFSTLPKDTTVQVSTYACPNLDFHFQRYQDLQGTNLANPDRAELFKYLSQKRVEFWKKGTTKSLFPGSPLRFRQFRSCLSVVFPSVNLKNESELEQIIGIKEGFIASLKASSIYGRTWTPIDLISWCRDILNPSRMLYDKPRNNDLYNELDSIRHQIVDSDTYMRITDRGDELNFGHPDMGNAISIRNYSVRQYPNYLELPNMLGLIGDPLQPNLNYSCPFVITMNVLKEDFEQARNRTTMKTARAIQNSNSPMARILPEYATKAEDWTTALKSFDDGGGGTLKVNHQLMLIDYPEHITTSEREAIAIWQNSGFSITKDDLLQMSSYLAALPMSMDKEMLIEMEQFGRFNTKTTTNVVGSMPIMAEWAGMGEPYINLFGRNGQAMGIDLFANPSGNYNAIVTGTSGSGKSFFINDIVRNYLGAGAQIWVIDVGRSYQKLCEFLGGQYIEFDANSNIVINPFDLVQDFAEDLNILKQMFALMISPNEPISDYQMVGLERCIQACWQNKGIHAQIDDLQAALLNYRNLRGELDHEIARLGEQIHSFTSNGVHGRWFNGQTTLNFNDDLVILELEELKSKPDLQAVIMRFILFRITTSMYLSRKQRKLVIIDEAWDLLDDSNPTSGKFIEGGYRRARKYQGGFLTGTQSAKDYLSTPAARAALNNSDWMFLLRGKRESVEALRGIVSMSEHMENQILSLTTQSGMYSEVFVYVAGSYGVGRLVSDPFNALLSSSKGEDFEAIRQRQEQGMSIGDAVEDVLRTRDILN